MSYKYILTSIAMVYRVFFLNIHINKSPFQNFFLASKVFKKSQIWYNNQKATISAIIV